MKIELSAPTSLEIISTMAVRARITAKDMLSKIGSYRQAIPPGVSLEHLRKPSIKPSPESESIFIPGKPESEIAPMDVDVGYVQLDSGTVSDSGTMLENWKAAWRNSGIVWEDSGTSSQHSGTALEDPGTCQPIAKYISEPII